MKICNCLTGLILLFAQSLFAQAPTVQWERRYNLLGLGSGYSVQQTSDGGYIAAGYALNPSQDMFLVRTNGLGGTLWTRAHGGAGDESAQAVLQISGGGYAALGSSTSFGAGDADVFLATFDASGNPVADFTYGGPGQDLGYDLQPTLDGGYIVASYTNSSGAGNFDFYLIKLSSGFGVEWSHTYGGSGNDQAYSVKQTSDGGYILAGQSNSFTAGEDNDVYVVKTDVLGDTLWTRTYGGSNEDIANAVDVTADGGYIIAGYSLSFGGNYDVFAVKTDGLGTAVWQQNYDGGGFDAAYDVLQSTDGGYVMAGWSDSFGGGDVDAYLLKTDTDGSLYWQLTLGGPSLDEARSLQQTSDGGYIFVGESAELESEVINLYLVKLGSDVPLSVELAAFEAISSSDGIRIRFTTASETNTDHFEIWRGIGNQFSQITTLAAHGNSSTEQHYEYLDSDVIPGQNYRYFLADVDVNGMRTEHRGQMVSASMTDASALPQNFSLSVYPNPFNPSTTLSFNLLESGNVRITIYDLAGKFVQTLAHGDFSSGEHRITFDGGQLPSGIYLAALQSGTFSNAKKLILLK